VQQKIKGRDEKSARNYRTGRKNRVTAYQAINWLVRLFCSQPPGSAARRGGVLTITVHGAIWQHYDAPLFMGAAT